MVEVVVLQHADNCGPGFVADWAAAHDVTLKVLRPDLGENLMPLRASELNGLIILGGPQSVNDDLPWLSSERILVRSLDQRNRPVFGICLGAQQIARAFAAGVGPLTYPQYGRTMVTNTPTGATLPVFEAHTEGITAFPGMTQTYSDELGAVQGFKYHRHLAAVQFHPELDVAAFQTIANEEGFASAPVLTEAEVAANKQLLFNELDACFAF
ncbi:type 1 glutamine amidotransferase [Lacticaseibacillus mingshuiensis]|uniref:Type 1 glutamine amidotransferase n=1 Tax=Lacticaseibacillus mingshuiensis TaxID=2799574 RepID=A0ABW4CHK6_9LACO|nr:type 1 glutamine amidotransferase [Lacticaseibacillus mingshuiensis]